VLLLLLLVPDTTGAAQDVSQPNLKAAFLYNFAKFAEWPADASPGGPLTLCVLHDGASEDALVKLVHGASIDGRAVTVSKGATKAKIRACHVLYIADAEPAAVAGILEEVKGAPVLTVGDGDAFHGAAASSGSSSGRSMRSPSTPTPRGVQACASARSSQPRQAECGTETDQQPLGRRRVIEWYHRLSLSRKLTAIGVVTATVALILAAAVLMAFDLSSARARLVRDTKVLADVIGSNSTAALTFGDAPLAEIIRAASANDDIVAPRS
jgi:hypothetical protein